MKQRNMLVVFVIAALGLTLSFGGTVVAQQKSIKEQLVGTWGYVSSNATRQDGNSLWGEHANGLFILTESGYFSWQVFRSDRPKFASNNRLNATPDELKATNQGSLAYFGTYSVDEANNTVTF